MALIGKDIEKAAALLREGQLVAIPTETVYGLAANALDAIAVARIFEVKKRPFFDPLIIHISSFEKAVEYCSEFPGPLKKLALAFWPGPLTLLLPKKNTIPDIVTSGLERVAVRVPDHELTLELLEKLNLPLAAPSANPFGYVSPTLPEHVNKNLGGEIDYILDGGACPVGLESTIAGIEEGQLCIYRLGGLAVEEIEKVAGKVILKINQSDDPNAPGQLKSHYAPRKAMAIGNTETLLRIHEGKKIGILGFGKIPTSYQKHFIINLSEGENLTEAAANLFMALRKMDESDVEIIIGNYVPQRGLGLAINDRLTRASAV